MKTGSFEGSFTFFADRCIFVNCKPKIGLQVYEEVAAMHITNRQLTLTALCAALISVLSPIAIPLGNLVPVSLATLAVMISAVLTGPLLSAFAVMIYILLGIMGLPVFAGFSSGASIAFGMTGGYIFGYLLLALCTGYGALLSRHMESLNKSRAVLLCSMIIGTLLLYTAGTACFMKYTGMHLSACLAACVLPFLPGDFVKMILVIILGERLAPLIQKR